MEAGLVDAIIQLQQLATPPPPKPTSATKIQSNDERIHSILHSFVNKMLNKEAEEKEETPKRVRLNQTTRNDLRHRIS